MVEIGDIFIINHKGIKKVYSGYGMCRCYKQEFEVSKFTKSKLSVYYDDLRTNRKCSCPSCRDKNKTKCIGVDNIIIIDTKVSRVRDKKINKILKNIGK
jgi:hypothetical protein